MFVDAPALEHTIYPARELGDRICGNCPGDASHSWDDHICKNNGTAPCDEKGCKCRDFACIEHPDGDCGEMFDE